ncbi:DUF3987 domain-containing protein [Mangrovimonas cancribranchiae]|uniref:DUF3987 domain-containing protein n=1 Tax=Mangrovimonas cancribranchiae TaxID=3080055 RepID=A0AAU6NWJ5_9FLAO
MQDNKNQTNIPQDIDSIDEIINKNLSTPKDKLRDQLNNIISKLPNDYRLFIEKSFFHLLLPKEYVLSSILFTVCNASGLAFCTEFGEYKNYGNLYFVLVGSRGGYKTPSMNLAIKPLKLVDDMEYRNYKEKIKDITDETQPKPKRKRLFSQETTIESLLWNHYQNKYSIGVYLDEISYFFDVMNNPKDTKGSQWRNMLLQGNTNGYIDVSRKTSESFRIEKSYPSVLGGIQHQLISKMFSNKNLESGLLDRFLFTVDLTKNSRLTKESMPTSVLAGYNQAITNIYQKRDALNDAGQEVCLDMVHEAKDKLYDYIQDKIDQQNNLESPLKEYLSKMRISIHKLVLLLHLIKVSQEKDFYSQISLETLNLAIELNEFYYSNFKLITDKCTQPTPLNKKDVVNEVINMAKNNNVPQNIIGQLTGYSNGYVSKLWNR